MRISTITCPNCKSKILIHIDKIPYNKAAKLECMKCKTIILLSRKNDKNKKAIEGGALGVATGALIGGLPGAIIGGLFGASLGATGTSGINVKLKDKK